MVKLHSNCFNDNASGLSSTELKIGPMFKLKIKI